MQVYRSCIIGIAYVFNVFKTFSRFIEIRLLLISVSTVLVWIGLGTFDNFNNFAFDWCFFHGGTAS